MYNSLMDFEMHNIQKPGTQEILWDFTIRNGKLATIDYAQADEQRAIMAVFLQRGAIPQLPATGNRWVEMLVGQTSPQQVNADVRDSIMNLTGALKFLPKYTETDDGKLSVEVRKV